MGIYIKGDDTTKVFVSSPYIYIYIYKLWLPWLRIFKWDLGFLSSHLIYIIDRMSPYAILLWGEGGKLSVLFARGQVKWLEKNPNQQNEAFTRIYQQNKTKKTKSGTVKLCKKEGFLTIVNYYRALNKNPVTKLVAGTLLCSTLWIRVLLRGFLDLLQKI